MNRHEGFTLIELMIVVAIIGSLAAIAIPRFAQMLEKSREGATKGNLSSIRSAVSLYYSEREGIFPNDLTTSFTGYLYPVPYAKASPLGNSNTVNLASAPPGSGGASPFSAALTGGWCYITDPASPYRGSIFANSTATDTKGNSFTSY